jgi:rubrerythrin
METDHSAEQERRELIRSHIERLREKEPNEIVDVIKRYSDYRPEAVEAALSVAVDRGLISWDLRNRLFTQICYNINGHWKRDSHYSWEENNAFCELVKDYTDDELYGAIEDPAGIVIDVYHAILSTAFKRELISKTDFEDNFRSAALALRSDEEVRTDEFIEYIFDKPADQFRAELPDPEKEKDKFWKCPSCGELVEMEIAVCWKCDTPAPDNAAHPSTEEMAEEIRNESKPGFREWTLFGLLFLLFAGGIVAREFIHSKNPFSDPVSIVLAVVAIIGLPVYVLLKTNRTKRQQ